MEKNFNVCILRNPNNPTDDVLKEISWPKFDSVTEFYLDVGNYFTVRQELAMDRYSVWDELEKSFGISCTGNFFFIVVGLLVARIKKF